MKRRLLGATALEVSPLGLGTVKFGRHGPHHGVDDPSHLDLPDRARLAELLARARELGVNLLDTAPAYGHSEERLGELLAGQRQEWIICTKAGEEFHDGRSRFDFSPAHIRHSVERSLRRLRTDYLDAVLLHSNGDDEWILTESGALETLIALKQQGLVRAVGISHKTRAGAELALARCDLVMATLNLDDRSQLEPIRAARSRGVGVLVKKGFGGGQAALDPHRRRRSLELALTTPGVASMVIGTIDPQHLEENVALATELTGG